MHPNLPQFLLHSLDSVVLLDGLADGHDHLPFLPVELRSHRLEAVVHNLPIHLPLLELGSSLESQFLRQKQRFQYADN